MRVGVLGETSGKVRDAFIVKGHEAVSCDLLPTDVHGPHIQGNFFDQDWSQFDLLICHPTCTYLCNSGVRWLHSDPERWGCMLQACEDFNRLQELPVSRICIENPVPHKYARERIGKYTQSIQPWQFGHGETKRTCLWLKGLPLLRPTEVVSGREGRIWKCAPSPDRWKIRSETYSGIASAMAEQWGVLE